MVVASWVCAPRPADRAPCGSKSTARTRRPYSAREAPRLMLVVVLPTPPFWLQRAMIFAGPCCFSGWGAGKARAGRPVGPGFGATDAASMPGSWVSTSSLRVTWVFLVPLVGGLSRGQSIRAVPRMRGVGTAVRYAGRVQPMPSALETPRLRLRPRDGRDAEWNLALLAEHPLGRVPGSVEEERERLDAQRD